MQNVAYPKPLTEWSTVKGIGSKFCTLKDSSWLFCKRVVSSPNTFLVQAGDSNSLTKPPAEGKAFRDRSEISALHGSLTGT